MFNGYDKQIDSSKVIFLDVDDTIADTRGGVYDYYVNSTGAAPNVGINVIDKNYSAFCTMWSDEQIQNIFTKPHQLYTNFVKPIPGAKEGVKALLDMGYDIRVVTLQSPSGVPAKHNWIERYFPELLDKVCYISDIHGNKDIFVGHAIIDDDHKNIKNSRCDKKILIDVYKQYPAMVNEKTYASSWKEVVKILGGK